MDLSVGVKKFKDHYSNNNTQNEDPNKMIMPSDAAKFDNANGARNEQQTDNNPFNKDRMPNQGIFFIFKTLVNQADINVKAEELMENKLDGTNDKQNANQINQNPMVNLSFKLIL